MLTKEEMLIVADAAESYPPGYGYDWTCDPDANKVLAGAGSTFTKKVAAFTEYG